MRYLLEQVGPQRAADAAVLHGHELLLGVHLQPPA